MSEVRALYGRVKGKEIAMKCVLAMNERFPGKGFYFHEMENVSEWWYIIGPTTAELRDSSTYCEYIQGFIAGWKR